MKTFEKAKDFIYKNARPIDLARWEYHFEGGSPEKVIKILATYQNEDGGFAYALEPDSLNTNSSPIETWCAIEILREINFTDRDHPIIKGILKYLESGKDFNGTFWANTIKSNNDYPHAPWWTYQEDSKGEITYNPTASLAGFIVFFASPNTKLYELGIHLVNEAIAYYKKIGLINEMHIIACYIRLLDYLEEIRLDLFDIKFLKEQLIKDVNNSITKDLKLWDTSYICKPSNYFDSNKSIFYLDNKEVSDYECEFIKKTQLDDGSWNITWNWADYNEEWYISKNWWKSNNIIKNMLYLKGMEKLKLRDE